MTTQNEKIIYVKRVEDTFVFDCPWCKGQHIHGAQEGHRSSHCSAENAPSGYVLKETK